MGGVGWYLIVTIMIAIPFWRLLPKFGISKYFAIMVVVPAMALILLWIMAFKDDVEGLGS
ncbi:MAG: hypothetical protein OXQ92_09330 [Boseongicola sp.]|nr:hypothetical protein [Boseongicola sp.]MDD9976175.1 hypothetical protein [Boseongicola sp.]